MARNGDGAPRTLSGNTRSMFRKDRALACRMAQKLFS
jgi:hypothetical protein